MKEKNRSPVPGILCILLGVVLLGAALALVFHNRQESQEAGAASRAVLESVVTALPPRRSPSIQDQPIRISEAEVIVPDMPTMEIDGKEYIGILEFPSLEMQLPVLANWVYEDLRKAPCRYLGSYYTNDIIIAAHSYESHFAPVRGIALGADVYFTNADGVVFHYTVDNVEYLQPTEVEAMTSGDWDMTLFTCTTGGGSRVTIRLVRAD